MNLHIETLQASQIPGVQRVLLEAVTQVMKWTPTPEETRNFAPDVDDAMEHYIGNGGTFWVLVRDEEIVGMGAVRRLDETVCELKRMWFLAEVRGQGWGRKMAQMLIQWARENGYQTMRLDSGGEPTFSPAIGLYRSLGFREIEDYNGNSKARIWMELPL